MPAKSKQQQKFFGVVKAMQKGDIPKKGEAGEVAKDMKKKDVDKYAGTKHKGLPAKVKEESISILTLKKMVREEFNNIIDEAKMTPGKVQKVQRDLVKTIDALKKNFPMYKAAKESGDEKKLAKHRDIAVKLTKKKKDLELQMDKALGGLYQDAKLDLKEAHKLVKVVGGYPVTYEGDPNNYRAIISEPMNTRQKTDMIKRAKQAGYIAKPNMAGGVTIFVKE